MLAGLPACCPHFTAKTTQDWGQLSLPWCSTGFLTTPPPCCHVWNPNSLHRHHHLSATCWLLCQQYHATSLSIFTLFLFNYTSVLIPAQKTNSRNPLEVHAYNLSKWFRPHRGPKVERNIYDVAFRRRVPLAVCRSTTSVPPSGGRWEGT